MERLGIASATSWLGWIIVSLVNRVTNFSRLRRLPVELWTCLVFIAIWLLGWASGLPAVMPSFVSLKYVFTGFVLPLILVALTQLFVLLKAWGARKQANSDPLTILKLLPMVCLTMFVYFNFKAWMPLVNPRLYDEVYQKIDLALWPVVQACIDGRGAVASAWMSVTTASIDSLYLGIYLLIILLSVLIQSLLDRPQGQRQLIFGLCLILLIGGLTYWIAPAAGPFLYRDGSNLRCLAAQKYMYGMFQKVRASGTIPYGYFPASVAAMPSLHIAHALFLTLDMARSARWLLLFYVPCLSWLAIESVASGWHYLVDLPAGAAVALVCFYLVKRLIPDGSRQRLVQDSQGDQSDE